MRLRNDGSVQSAATPTYQNAGRKEDYALYRCMVTKVVYCDDPNNITKNSQTPRVLYDVVVLGGFASGQIISNCRLSSDLGGMDSYWERVLRAAEKSVSEAKLSESDGDIVFVQFIQGHTGAPVIVGLDQGVNMTKTKTAVLGTKLEKGPRSIRLYNGVYEEIDKDGQLIQMIYGGKSVPEKGKFTPAEKPLVTTKTDKDEKITRTFKGGLKTEEDGKNDSITATFKGGLIVKQDGKNDKVTITTKGGLVITFDGKSDDLTLKTKGGAELKLKDAKVALGSGSVEILDKLSKVADLVSQWATNTGATHTHIGNLGYPTAPPTQAAGYTSLGSDLATVKGDVDGIKGSL